MRILGENEPEDCIDGGLIKEYRMDSVTTVDFLDYLGCFGELNVLKDLKSPFYSVNKEYFFTIKGVLGEMRMRVAYRKENMKTAEEFFHKLLESYSPKDVEKSRKKAEMAEKAALSKIKA
jgi:hypothetical protein